MRIVYSPLDAVEIAVRNRDRKIVFFAVGFETTAPANAEAIREAKRRRLTNFFVLVSQVTVPAALTWILQAPGNRVQGFLGPGHVCSVVGQSEYEAFSRHYRVPVVVTGFEPVDILDGVLGVVRQLEAGEARVENRYRRVVSSTGNTHARLAMEEVFAACDRAWRGIGMLPKSGLRLTPEYRQFDAELEFDVATREAPEPADCISGQILRGLKKPKDCPSFGGRCTPGSPLGATMVSSEGACAAYFAYRSRSAR